MHVLHLCCKILIMSQMLLIRLFYISFICVCFYFFFIIFFFLYLFIFFFFSSRRRHTRFDCDWSSDVCSSDLATFVVNAIGTAPFVVNGTNLIVTGNNLVTLTGTAPPTMTTITINGLEYPITRSEERRVGKECRSRWSTDH